MNTVNPQKYNFFLRGGDSCVLLIHGITGTPSEMRYYGKALNRAGYSVACNALPRHCGSLGDLRKVRWQEIVSFCLEDFARLKKEFRQVFVGGLSMGALMGIHIASQVRKDVSGILALAPTLFYDGWALHKGKCLMELVWHVPFLRNSLNIREGWPYGLKDEKLRGNIERFYKGAKADEYDDQVLLFGSPFFPMACLYQHHCFTEVVKKELSSVDNPILILHAKEDDMTSLRNATYVYDRIASKDKSLVILEDSYHMITIDKDKDRVAEESVKFLNRIR